jgi:hypothetical protein
MSLFSTETGVNLNPYGIKKILSILLAKKILSIYLNMFIVSVLASASRGYAEPGISVDDSSKYLSDCCVLECSLSF